MISLPWLSLLISFFWFALGSCLGSFLNLCANRLRREESIIWGRSHCDSCGHILGPGELIPLVSYLRQKGKCRHCGKELTVSDRKSTRLNSSHMSESRMPSSA